MEKVVPSNPSQPYFISHFLSLGMSFLDRSKFEGIWIWLNSFQIWFQIESEDAAPHCSSHLRPSSALPHSLSLPWPAGPRRHRSTIAADKHRHQCSFAALPSSRPYGEPPVHSPASAHVVAAKADAPRRPSRQPPRHHHRRSGCGNHALLPRLAGAWADFMAGLGQ
jgi:hypothetical protein